MIEMVNVSRARLEAVVDAEARVIFERLPEHWSPEQRQRAEEQIRIGVYLEWTQPDLVARIREERLSKGGEG